MSEGDPKDGGPRRISNREVPLSITGYFMPTHAPNAPVLMAMPGTDDLFLFVFSTEEKLASAMASFGTEYERIAVVTDGRDLIAEINETNASGERPYRIRLAVDPYKADNGRVRFVEPFTDLKANMVDGTVDVPRDLDQATSDDLLSGPKIKGSALATMQHAEGCKCVRENGVAVWMCVGSCPAMYEFIRSGQVDHQPWDRLDDAQVETVKRAVSEHALGSLDKEKP
ncbi:MAG TPA: hypothetical protein VLE97_08880 [Gaiellaceae bacterium]|nr:hypothetical protein [Gaiellaceae bacterium]